MSDVNLDLNLSKYEEPIETNENTVDVKTYFNDNFQNIMDFANNVKTKINENDTQQTVQDNKISSLETDNETNKTDISSIKTEQATQNTNIETLQTDNETNKTNISTLQTDVKTNKENIENIQEKNTEQDANIVELQTKNALLEKDYEDSEVTGESILVEDAMNYYASIGVEGKTEQETSDTSPSPDYPSEIKNVGSNINLFNKDTMTTGYYLDSTGAEIAKSDYSYSDYIPVEENEKYTYYQTKIVNSWATKFCYYDANKEFVNYNDYYPLGSLITIPSGVKYVRFSIRLEDYDIFKFEKGVRKTEYSNYNCGNVSIYKRGKNYFDINNAFTALGSNAVKINDDGSITSSSNFSKSRTAGTYLYLRKNTDYTVSIKYNSMTNSSETSNTVLNIEIIGYIGLRKFDKVIDTKKISNLQNAQSGTKYSLTFNSGDYNYIVLSITAHYGSENTGSITYSECMVEEGTKATEYEEYKGEDYTFPLEEGQYLCEGDYLANDGIHHKKGRKVLEGTESWELLSNYFKITPSWEQNTSNGNIGISNYFKQKNTWGAATVGIWLDKNLIITTEGSIDTTETLTDFKSWLAEKYSEGNPVIIEYEFATETVEAYTDEQQEVWDKLQEVLLEEGTNNIMCSDNILPNLTLKYKKSNKIRLQKLEEKIATLTATTVAEGE